MASLNLQGSSSGQVTLTVPADAGSNTLTLPATTQTLATQNALGVRNLIINGDMRIAQRGTSFASANGYTLDRWVYQYDTSGAITITQDTDVPTGQGFDKSLKIATTTSYTPTGSQTAVLRQKIEGNNLVQLKKGTSSAESVTVSFWVKSNLTGTFIVEVHDTDNSRSISKAYTISSADTWEKQTITFAGDTSGVLTYDNSEAIRLSFPISAGPDAQSGTLQTSWGTLVQANRFVGQTNVLSSTSNYINITGVQLEVGDTATPFEHRPYDMELARCQRYYYSMGGNSAYEHFASMSQTGGTDCRGIIYFPVPMRTIPSIYQSGSFMASSYNVALTGTYSSGSTMYISISSFGGIQNFGFDFWAGTAGSFTVNNGAMWILRANNSTSTRLGFNAEL